MKIIKGRDNSMTDLNYLIKNDYLKFKDYFLDENKNIKFYKAGTYLNNFNEDIDNIYYIVDGLLINKLICKNGYEKAFIAYGENTITPLYSPGSFPIEKSLSLQVVKDAHLITFSRKEFKNLLNKNSSLNDQMYLSYIKTINFLFYEYENLLTNKGITRIAIFLHDYINTSHPEDNIIPLSQKEIASLVGLNLINTCKNIKVLKEMNILLPKRNKIIILDLDKLASLCESTV